MKEPKYEYYLYTWGGFYNDVHVAKHGEKDESIPLFFDTAEERQKEIDRLEALAEKHNAKMLMTHIDEGYHVRTPIVLNRVVEYKGKRYHTQRDMNPLRGEFNTAKYHLENKWYPGFNDYPLGEDFDDYGNVSLIQEWITGSFKTEEL